MEYIIGYTLIFNDSGFIGAIENLKVSIREYTSTVDSYVERVKEEIENLLRCDNISSIKALEKLKTLNDNKNMQGYEWLKVKRNMKSNNKNWNKKMFYE